MIRKGCRQDLQQIMNIVRRAVDDMESKHIYQWDSIYPNEEVIRDDISEGDLYTFEDSGIIKGIIVLNEFQDREYEDIKWEFNKGKQLVVHRLCIDPLYQGQGIARLLMGFAEDCGREKGYESIRFDTFVNNRRACGLYEKLGYKAVGTVTFRKGEFYCFEKKL